MEFFVTGGFFIILVVLIRMKFGGVKIILPDEHTIEGSDNEEEENASEDNKVDRS